MLNLLFVDDSIVDFDPGDFPDTELGATNGSKSGDPIGVIGYYILALEEIGFNVLTATSVDQALDVLNEVSSDLDVIVLDVMMPYLNRPPFDLETTAGGLRTGYVLAEEIHGMYANIPIWILSNIVPQEGSLGQQGTVADLISRGVVAQVVWKSECGSNEFATRLHNSLRHR